MDASLPYFVVAVGLVLIVAELLLMTGGVLFVLGVAGLVAGVAMLFAYDATQGLVTLLGLFVLLPAGAPLVLAWWRRTALGRRLILDRPDEAVAGMPVNLELEQLRGRFGRTVSPLRPAGVTEFDGRRVDTLSEGPLIEAGQWVRCVDVRDGRVVVRPVPAPPDLGDFDLKDLNL